MEDKNYQKDLKHIRLMMEQSSKFISLSGLSGVSAGVIALIGAVSAYLVLQDANINYFEVIERSYNTELVFKLVLIALVVLVLSISFGCFFTARSSKRKGLKIWDSTSKRLITHLCIPLFTGGIFCLALIYHHYVAFIAPSMLVFYGLGLINASKFTLNDVKYLGVLEVCLGLISMFFLGWGLVTWSIGFGIFHIVYGILMYKKYQ